MCEVINGRAQRDHLGGRYAFDGTHHTIDGVQRDDAPRIVDKLVKSDVGLLPTDMNYLDRDWLYAQLVFWNLDGDVYKSRYGRGAMMELLRKVHGLDTPVWASAWMPSYCDTDSARHTSIRYRYFLSSKELGMESSSVAAYSMVVVMVALRRRDRTAKSRRSRKQSYRGSRKRESRPRRS